MRFERSNGLDTVLYKNTPLPLCTSLSPMMLRPSPLTSSYHLLFRLPLKLLFISNFYSNRLFPIDPKSVLLKPNEVEK